MFMELIKIHFNFRNEKFELLSQGTFQNFRKETLFTADFETVRKFTFDWMTARLWIKESTILWNVCTFAKMILDEYQGLFVCKSSSSFSHNFTANYR